MEDVERSRLKSGCKISLNEIDSEMVNYPQIPISSPIKNSNHNCEQASSNFIKEENERKRKGSPPGADFLGFKKHCIQEATEYYRKCLKYSTLNFSSNLYNLTNVKSEETEKISQNIHDKNISNKKKEDTNGTTSGEQLESLETIKEQSSNLNSVKETDVNTTACKSDTHETDSNLSQNLNSTKSEYAQYLGLQPTVKFKCIKCSTSNFPTLDALNKHYEKCPEQQMHDRENNISTLSRQSLSSSNDTPSTSTPSSSTNFKITRRVFLCSACGVYFEIWKLFLHMRTAHRRYICLICLGLFSVAEKLSNHLIVKHNVVAKNYDSVTNFFRDYTGQIFVMCCSCERMFTEKDNFAEHICELNSKDKTKSSNNIINSSYSCITNNSINNQTQSNHLEEFPTLKNSTVTNIKNMNKNTQKTSNLKLANKSSSKLKNKILPSEHVTADTALDSAINQISDNAKEIISSIQSSVQNIPDDSTTGSQNPTINVVAKSDIESHDSKHEMISENEEKNITKQENQETNKLTETDSEELKDNTDNDSENRPESTSNEENDPKEQENKILEEPAFQTMSEEPETNEKTVQSPPLPVIEKQDNIDDDKTEMKLENTGENPTQVENSKNEEELNLLEEDRITESDKSDISKEVMPSQVCDEQRRVPKVTLKIPPITKNIKSVESESDSDDSLKLTMEFDDNASISQENKNETSNNLNDSNLDNTKQNLNTDNENVNEVKKENFIDGIPVADSNIPIVELGLRPPLDKVTIQSLLKDFIRATCFTCVYCNYARKIAVNGKQLGLHMIAEHRYSATADSITGEELLPETFVKRIKEDLEPLQTMYFNLESYDNQDSKSMIPYDRTYECFQCRFVTTVHKELYLHNRKMHQKTLLLCVMCKSTFYSYSELLCHLCPGVYLGTDVMFRCCLCPIDNLPSAFRLMVHLRKRHHACDVCLETCNNQAKLSNHVWKHKLHHLCYRCGIAYRNKPDITKHLFWKHGTESVLCKKCLQKKWPHVYHFCIPPLNFTCDECNKSFMRAVALKVHKRLHSNIKPYACTEENCSEQFISKKLLEKHTLSHRDPSILNQVINTPTLESEPDVVEVDTKETKSTEEECLNVAVEDNNDEIEKEASVESKAKPVVDVYDLPALNLSESDSDSDDETPSITAPSESKPSDEIIKESKNEDTEIEDTKPVPIVDGVWDNFKNYQAAVEKRELQHDLLTYADNKAQLNTSEESCIDSKKDLEILIETIKDDHDYCSQSDEKQNTEQDKDKMDHDYCFGNENERVSNKEAHGDNAGNELKNKTNSDSSSDTDSSSCSCGSNCSCSSSSSGSSSSSSSSSDSDSSSSESRRKNLERRQKRKEKVKNKKKVNEISVDDITSPIEQPTEQNVQPTLPVDLPIYESDLYTDESETDEDFYDECPQLLAKKLIEEKKNQLLLDVGGPPSLNGSIFETSRSSTPNIPEEQMTKKKQKIKSKKRKKNPKSKSPIQNQEVLPLKLNIPHSYFAQQTLHNNIYSPVTSIATVTTGTSIQSPKLSVSVTNIQSQSNQVISSISASIPSITFNSNTGSGSETDSTLRLSKRRRVPNKFYGYSSDEDSSSRIAAKQPPEPPQLQWNKEDLPSPPRIPAVETPYVPTTIWNKTTVSQITPQTVQAPPSSSDSSESDADSDDERLHISQPNYTTASNIISIAPPVSSNPVATTASPLQSIVPRPAENLYCYCQCPYDEVSEMIACDGKKCAIEWFHFECVGIMVPPKGKWFCPDCRKQNSQQRSEYFASQ